MFDMWRICYNLAIICYTKRRIGTVVMEDEVDQHAMVVADESRTRGTEVVSTVVDPPQTRGFRVESETGQKIPPIVGITAGKFRSCRAG